jgi:serine/threonine protein kinase/Tfp pilus assembly protein PilF
MDMGFRFDDSCGSLDARRSTAMSFSMKRARKRELLEEQRAGWAEGRPASPEELLGRWPTDPSRDPDAASLLLEDYLQRRRRGEDGSLSEYQDRFPEQGRALEGFLARETVYRSMGRESQGEGFPLRLPEVGDEVFGFRLRRPLGEGAFARVFLAEQADLAGRPVVLKISDMEGSEPQTLAQLLHTNIVPIYSLHEDRRAGLRAVCMPYLGGASLSAVLARLWSDSPRPTSGEQFVRALETIEAPRPDSVRESAREGEAPSEPDSPESAMVAPSRDRQGAGAAPMLGQPLADAPGSDQVAQPLADARGSDQGGAPPEPTPRAAAERPTPLAALRGMRYEYAAAWIVAQLAEGLHHAHQRGVLHRDIKPSNVLISAEGQPLLLDFNLAQGGQEDPAHATIGGTVAYMAPEHLRALVGRTPALIRQVDARSDIYSLGMVLAEVLTGHRPFQQSGSYSAVPLQIEAMALERSRAAASVRRERPDLSWGLESIARMCLAPDPARRYQRSDHLAEDLRRLLEDRPLKYAPELSRVERARKFARRHPRLASSATVTGAAALVLMVVGSALAAARSQLADSRARDLVRAHDAGMQQALCLVNTRLDLEDHLRDGIAACERTLALLGAPGDGDWTKHPAWGRLSAEDRRRLAEDRRELVLLLADARVRMAAGSKDAAEQALRWLELAESIPGLPDSRALWLDRARYRTLRSDPEAAEVARRRAERIPATTARDHYLIASSLARQGSPEGLRSAITELDEALKLNPRHFWSLVQRGICHLERGELVAAAGDFGQCTGLWPEFAWGYFNRGCVLDRAGDKAAAVLDYTAALERDPGLVPAYVNRGLARLELRQEAPALADFDRAIALGARGAAVSAGRGVALERLGRHGEADAAFAEGFAQAGGLTAEARARLASAYGFAIAAHDPARARVAFDEALRHDPRDARALYGLGMIAMTRGECGPALRHFDKALAADPGRPEARRYRAILLARKGDWDAATREINRCLEREPRSSAALYAAACVVARAYGAIGSDATAAQALDLLERAVAEGADASRAAEDPDLAAIRRLPRFRRLVDRAAPPAAARPTILRSSAH